MQLTQDTDGYRFGERWREGHFSGETAFNNMRRAFGEAVAALPAELHEYFYVFAGHTVHARVVGNELARNIDRPFAHLRVHQITSPPELTIDIWDDNKTRQHPIPVDPDEGWYETTVKSMDQRFVGERLPNTFCCLDRETKHIIAAIAWHDRIFIYERAKPLRRALLNWYNDRDVQIIHTGLVARDHKGLLLVGKSGSGKSTSSLACIMGGFDYLGEDYIGLQTCPNGSFVGHSMYNSVFLETDHLGRFTELAPYAIRGRLPHEEKSVLILSQVFPQRLVRAVPIRALVVPRVGDAPDTRFEPASKGEALLALAPSSLFQVPNRALGVPGFVRLAQLVERIPCFRLELGRKLSTIPRCLDELCSELRES